MKKMRKIISLIVALAFLFSIAAPAMAAEPTAAEKAGNRLLALKIIEGYTDGTLGLDKQITRAEIAVILAKASGMATAADMLKDTPSKFSDVKVGEWYTGWINLAASQGWVKGDPQGTFRPNDPVSYREIVTMVMKILGYNDNLPGDWPTDYLAKAASLGITKGISFDSKAPAVRGDVFTMTSKALDEDVVTYDKDEDKFVSKGKSLLEDKLDFAKREGVVTDIPRVASSLKDNQIKIDGKLYKVAVDVDYEAIFGTEVTAWLNDDDEVVFVDIESDTVIYDALEDVTKDELTLVDADEDYDLADDVVFYVNGAKLKASEVEALNNATFDYAKVVLNDDGDVAFVDAYNWDDFLVVEKVDGYDVLGYGDEIDAEDYVIVKEGKTITLDDLEKGDILFYSKTAEYAEVFNKFVEGEISRIYTDRFTVDGKDYKYADAGAKYIDEKGDIASFTSSNFEDVIEEMQDAGKVVVFVNRAGDLVFVSGDLGNLVTTSKYVFVTEPSKYFENRGKGYYTLDVLNDQGAVVKYDILASDVNDSEDSILKDVNGDSVVWAVYNGDPDSYTIQPYSVIEISFESDGDIDEIRLLDASNTISSQFKTTSKYVNGIKIDSDAIVFLTEDYQNYTTDDTDDIEISSYSKLDFDYINSGTAFVKDDKVVAFVVNKSNREEEVDTYQTVVTSSPVKVSGKDIYKIGLAIDGAKVSKDTKEGVNVANIARGKFVEVDIDQKTGNIVGIKEVSGEERIISPAAISNIKTADKSFVINGKTVKLGANAVIVDATESSYTIVSSLSNLKAGDTVKALRVSNNSSYVDVVVRIAKAGSAPVVSVSETKLVSVSSTVVGAVYMVTATLDVKADDDIEVRLTDADGKIIDFGALNPASDAKGVTVTLETPAAAIHYVKLYINGVEKASKLVRTGQN